MRILHVNKFFDLHGGAEVYMHRLMKMQTEAGYEVHALSTTSEKNLPSPDQGSFVKRYAFDRWEGVAKDARKAMNFLWNREAEEAMREAIKRIQPDVIHLHNIYHHLSTSILRPIREFGIPCVQTLHDYKLACPNYKMFTQGAPCERCKGGKYWNAVLHDCVFASFAGNSLVALEMGMTKMKQSYEKTVRVFICPSKFIREKMEDWGEPRSKLTYVPNPVTLSESPAPRGGGYLLYAGRLSQEKGVQSFLEAAVQLPDLPVKIAGRGPEEERLRQFVRDKGASHIEFLGFQAPEDLTRIRRRAEALVLPTLSYENASGVILEAMSDGIPVLATRIGGNPELVQEDVNGLLVTPNDVKDWLRALRRFTMLSNEVRMRMGEAGHRMIEQGRTWDKHLSSLSECYKIAGAKKR